VRFAALLRGVMPTNCKMPALARAFEAAGFANVKTVLGSGNVLFDARGKPSALARRAEAAMQQQLGRGFPTIVRPISELRALVEADPFAAFRLAKGSKRVVTFLPARSGQRNAIGGKARAKLALPIAQDGARILAVRGEQILSAYVPGPRGPVFMSLIERTFGHEVTTRTWDTVKKLVELG
jgi:uncharacterized protein (DUF1697 family)